MNKRSKKALLITLAFYIFIAIIIIVLNLDTLYNFKNREIPYNGVFNTKLEHPKKVKKIYADYFGMDPQHCFVWSYEKEDITKMQQLELWTPVEEQHVSYLIDNYFLKFIGEKDKERYNKKFDDSILKNEENMYVFLDEQKLYSILLIMDTKNNKIYEFYSNY